MLDQKIIDLFDAYTHGAMTRQEFMQRLTLFTGSVVAASAVLPLLEVQYEHAETTSGSADELETRYIEYPTEGGKARAYLAMPKKKKKRAAVMVIHENRELNPHIEDVTRRVALAGFIGLAPDALSPFGGTPADADAAREKIGQLDAAKNLKLFLDGLAYLRTFPKSTGKVGCVGFCWGGAMVNSLAVNDPQLNAGVAYYGRQAAAADVPKIHAALMLHYGGLDTRINEGIPAYEAALKANNKDYQIFVYPEVNHAFNNDTAPTRYNEAAAKLAWERTIAFFGEKMK